MSRNAGFSSRSIALLICAIALAFAFVGSLGRAGALPAVRTWQGGSGPNWSTPGNWTPAGAPVDGEQLVFPASTNLTSNNDITGLDLDSLVFADNYAVTGNALTLDAGVTVTAGSPSLGFAGITLSGATTTFDVASASTLTVTSPIRLENSLLTAPNAGTIITHGINGSGGLVAAVVASEFELDGAVANAIHGDVQAGAGALRVLPLSGDCLPVGLGLHVIGGELVVTGTLELGCPTLVDSGTALAGSGNLILSRTGIVLTLGGTQQSTFAGVISGPGGVAVVGDTSAPPGSTPPALVLQGANTYTGATNATAGYIALDHGSITSPVTVNAGGAFGGQGSSGPISVTDALLFPGLTGTPAVLTTTSLSLTAQSTARFLLAGTTPGTGYDQIATNGTVALGGAHLELELAPGFDPPIGSTYTLISHEGTAAVTGTFLNLPEGTTFIRNGNVFTISYKGGSGSDVVVTRERALPADLSITKTATPTVTPAGGTVTFTLTVANAGPNDAAFPQVSDTLPPALLFQSIAAPVGWTCSQPLMGSAGNIACQATSIANGDTATFTVTTTVASGASGIISNTAVIGSAASDDITTNNSATATVTIGTGLGYRVTVAGLAAGR